MFRARCVIAVLIIHIHCYAAKIKDQSFKVSLKNIQACKEPKPPFAKKATIKSYYEIKVLNGTKYLSGNTTVTKPTPFLNFSGRTFELDKTGKRVLKLQVSEVSCRNLLARAIMMFSNLSFSKKNCMVHKGVFWFDNLDLNKISHALPGWHAPGDVVHELQLVVHGATEACNEILVQIR